MISVCVDHTMPGPQLKTRRALKRNGMQDASECVQEAKRLSAVLMTTFRMAALLRTVSCDTMVHGMYRQEALDCLAQLKEQVAAFRLSVSDSSPAVVMLTTEEAFCAQDPPKASKSSTGCGGRGAGIRNKRTLRLLEDLLLQLNCSGPQTTRALADGSNNPKQTVIRCLRTFPDLFSEHEDPQHRVRRLFSARRVSQLWTEEHSQQFGHPKLSTAVAASACG